MGNLSNLYISQSFVSLIHLATNEAATAASTELQDGLGNGIGVYVNTAGALSASVYSGSVAGIGNVSAFSASVSSRINAISASGGIPAGTVSSSAQITALGFATTASVDALSTSVDSRLDALEFKDGTFVTTSSFASFTSSYFTDSSSVDSRLDSLQFADGTFVTTASFNTFSTSVDSRLDGLEAFSASSDARYVNASETSSMAVSSSLYAVTSSYAVNGGVTQILAGPNITISPLSGKGQVTITSTGTGSGNFNTATGSYGSFYDTTTQINPVANTARSMSFNETAITNGVSISGSTNPFNTYIKTENAGVYNLQFSAQLDKIDSGTDSVDIWIRKNGIDLLDTGTTVTLTGNNDKSVAAWNWFVQSAANDYYQIIWSSADTDMRLLAEVSSSVHPGIPSVIATANRVDQFLSNTGSFTGSFNGYNLTEFATTGSNSFSGSQIVSGSLVVTGSVKGNISTITISSNTASIDFSLGSFFNLQLVSSSVPTFVTATNVKAGTTANLLVTQASTLSGSLRWGSNFKFPSGSSYTGSVSSSAKDIVSFVMYDDTTIYSVGAKNLI